MKKPVVMFTVANEAHYPFAKQLEKSLRKFHTEKELPLKIVSGQTLSSYQNQDSKFHLRSTPFLAENLLKEYELVIKIDSQSVITGDLNYVLETKDYDVATVRDWNRIEVPSHSVNGLLPIEYFSSNFVAIRSEVFAHLWNVDCDTPQFDRLAGRETDILNILCYYGNFNVRCLDDGDGVAKHQSWYGNISRSFWAYIEIDKDRLYVPKQEGDRVRKVERDIRILNFKGQMGERINYKNKLDQKVQLRIEELIK